MAQARKGGLTQSLFKPIHGNGAIYFYPGVSKMTWSWYFIVIKFLTEKILVAKF